MPQPTMRFIGEPVEAQFDDPPLLTKKPGCPDRFVWRDQTYTIQSLLAEWHDYGRRGRMARNMRPAHLQAARQHGSWGVGRNFFRVRTVRGRVFDLYYDRAPKGSDDRAGTWMLYREIVNSASRDDAPNPGNGPAGDGANAAASDESGPDADADVDADTNT